MSFSPSEKIGPPGLTGEVVRFADFLKGRGFKVFQSSVHDALRSLKEIDLSKRQDFFASLRANLTNTDMEWVQFANLFEKFWHRKNKGSKEPVMTHQHPDR